MQERRCQVGRLWPGHWSTRGPAGLVWYVVTLNSPKQKSSTVVHYLFNNFTFARRVCWNTRLPFSRSAKKGGLWETCGHLGMWWVTRFLPIEFFASISIFFLSRWLSRHPTHIQTHQLSDVESSFRQVLSRGCCQAPLSPSSCFTSTFSRVSLVVRFNFFADQ